MASDCCYALMFPSSDLLAMRRQRGQVAGDLTSPRPRVYSWRAASGIEQFQGASAVKREARVDSELPDRWCEFEDALQLVDAAGLPRVHGGVCRLVAQFLQARSAEDQPSAWLGSENLLLVNPRRVLHNQYSAEAIAAHQRQAALGLTLPPHVYSIAQTAVDSAVAALLQLGAAVADETTPAAVDSGEKNPLDHVICFVGDVGSGKTEAARATLGYLAQASVGRRQPPLRNRARCLEHKLIAANEILDAFGRSRSSKSPHGSQFGRSLQVQYDERGCAVSVNVQTYCLGSSRVARPQSLAGSNFDIFYLLCDGASDRIQVDLKLSPDVLSASAMRTSFDLLSSEVMTADARSSTADDFKTLELALFAVGVDAVDQIQIWTLLAAILFLGNIDVDVTDDPGNTVDNSLAFAVAHTPEAEHAAELLYIKGNAWDHGQLYHALSTATRSHGGEETRHCMDAAGILRNRDRLVVGLYDGLFAWLTEKLNGELSGERGRHASSPSAASATASVWLMDTMGCISADKSKYDATNFGFHHFCANYTAEKLHCHYIRHSFLEEEAAYRADELLGDYSWSVDSNEDLIAIIEGSASPSAGTSSVSILAVLNYVTEQPTGTESEFRARLETELPQNSHWATHAGSACGFVVRHFRQRVNTMSVAYDAMDFVQSNRVALSVDIRNALQHSFSTFVEHLVGTGSGAGPSSPTRGTTKEHGEMVSTRSVTMQSEISRLCGIIDKASCHFVRCLSVSDGADTTLLESQLQRANVEELVTTRTQGYNERLGFDMALHRWRNVRPRGGTTVGKLEATKELMGVLRMPSQWHISPDSQTLFIKARAVRQLDCLGAIAMLIPYVRGRYAKQQFEHDRAIVTQLQLRIRAREAIAQRISARFSWFCANPHDAAVGECYQSFQQWFAWRGVEPVAMLDMQKLTNALVIRSRERLSLLRVDSDFVSIQRALEDCKGARQSMPDEYAALVKHRDDIMTSMYQQMQSALGSPESSTADAVSALNLFRSMRDCIDEPNIDVYEALEKRLRQQRDLDEAEITKYLQIVSDDTWDDVTICKYEQLSRAYYKNGMGLRNIHETICEKQASHYRLVHQQVQSVLRSIDHMEINATMERLRRYQHDEFADDVYRLRQRLEDLLPAAPTRLVMQVALETGDPTAMSVALRIYEMSNEPVQAVLHDLVPELQRSVEKSQLLADIAVLRNSSDANRIRQELAVYDQTQGDLAAEEREELREYANGIVSSVREEIVSALSSDDEKIVSSALLNGEQYKHDEQISAPLDELQAHFQNMLRQVNECIRAAIDGGDIVEMNDALRRYEGWDTVELEHLRLSLKSQLQIIAEKLINMMSSRDFYAMRDVLDQHSDYRDQLNPSWHNLNRRYRELVDEYRAHSKSLAEAENVTAADLTAALVESHDPIIIALASRMQKQHKLAIAEADEVISELEEWLDEMRGEHERVQSEYEDNMSNMTLRKVGTQVQHRALRRWRQFVANRVQMRRTTVKVGMFLQHSNLFASFTLWRKYATEAARAKATLQLARKKIDNVWLRTSWLKLRRRCSAARYARLQAEYVRAEKQILLCQTETARLHVLQVSRSVRQHKQSCFNAWCWRTQKRYRASRKVLCQRATKRLRHGMIKSLWCKWCRVIEIESWYRAQMEAERCIHEVDERCRTTIDAVRTKALFAIRGRISTLRTYFLLWHTSAGVQAREHQVVQIKLAHIEFMQLQLQGLFTHWVDTTHAARFVKKHKAALHRERMRSAKVKMRSQSLCVRFTERRFNTDRMLTFFALWGEYCRTMRQNKHVLSLSLQRLLRTATANAWYMWCEVVGRSRLLRKASIKIKYMSLKAAFDAWHSLRAIAAEEEARSHLCRIHAEKAFGRHTQAQIRYVFGCWGATTLERLKSRRIMRRVVYRREFTAMKATLTRWVECARVEQRERRERLTAREMEQQRAALQEAQALVDRSEIGHMLSPRLATVRRAFRVWKTVWQDHREISLILVRVWRVQVHRTLRGAFAAWWKAMTNFEKMSAAQLAAQGKALLLHGNGPALARWFYNRCDSVTKRIRGELTQLVADSQLYQQEVDIGGEWQIDVPPSQELNGWFLLRTLPLDKTARSPRTPRKANHLLGTPGAASRSPSARLGNPYVYAASQTRGKPDFLDCYAKLEAKATTPVRHSNDGRNAGSHSRSSNGEQTPKRGRASPVPELFFDESGEAARNCCIFELRMD